MPGMLKSCGIWHQLVCGFPTDSDFLFTVNLEKACDEWLKEERGGQQNSAVVRLQVQAMRYWFPL
jgi:hypothetical protein